MTTTCRIKKIRHTQAYRKRSGSPTRTTTTRTTTSRTCADEDCDDEDGDDEGDHNAEDDEDDDEAHSSLPKAVRVAPGQKIAPVVKTLVQKWSVDDDLSDQENKAHSSVSKAVRVADEDDDDEDDDVEDLRRRGLRRRGRRRRTTPLTLTSLTLLKRHTRHYSRCSYHLPSAKRRALRGTSPVVGDDGGIPVPPCVYSAFQAACEPRLAQKGSPSSPVTLPAHPLFDRPSGW